MTIGIVGLGLIGGSLARAVRANTPYRLLGMDADSTTEQTALSERVINALLRPDNLPECDLVILALYPGASVDYLTAHASRIKKGACVVDVCGVKRRVCEALVPLSLSHGFNFVGGHPMAGRELSGYAAGKADLFRGASMLLIPHADTPRPVLTLLEDFFIKLGFGQIKHTDAATHDRIIAYTSQLAHVLSNAYVKSPQALLSRGFTGGSFQDLTRVATLNPDMWTELFFENEDYLLEEIEALCQRLSAYAEALRSADAPRLRTLLKEGSDWKAKIL